MTGRGRAVLATGLLVVIVTAACTSATDVATTRAVDALVPVPTEAPTTPSTRTLAPCEEEHAAEASYPALDAVPAPHQMPADSAMERIQNEEELVVGVDESTKYFSTREGNGFVGFEPDLARLIARSIFGDHGKVTFVPVVTEDKTKVVMNGDVDMTIDVVSKTCKRWGEVDFSSTYYETSQRILVRSDSPIKGVADLKDRSVCVTSGSSSETYAEKETEAVVVPVTARPDCLEALQENRVDAVLLPYSILAGLAYQDSTTKILEPRLKAQSYGIAISKDNPELVQFVNALLERWRTDHTLEDLQQQSLPLRLQTTPVAPDPVYLEPDERLD